ncbi:carbohydrate ABC transporter permease [Paenibacillus sambharensis]|uniref:Carbohydrate ABC transporter permease n=1 Tax=Paenibacillus sambharensis TaxID=1803190 RepID=A0A2W1LFC8_9BACL|nr:carbohydrate ABC transporter permease [Paenibacillus sambharensis]PZD97409.1 carbohydrate ABC transporter permease [Paenibacillus sambharensis]
MNKPIGKIISYSFLTLMLVFSIFPFYWMFVIASRTTADTNKFPPAFTPGSQFMSNIDKMFNEYNIQFFRALGNTALLATTLTLSALFFCSLAAFAFSRLSFKGRSFLFIFLLMTMMIPGQLGIVPLYIIMTKFGWINDLRAVLLPGLVSVFGVFWLKQYMDSAVHRELIESARMDGCTNFQTYYKIVVPIVKPAMATLAILTFMNVWNDFLWPSIVLKDPSVQTIQIAIRNLNKVYYKDNAVIMTGTFLATIPLLVMVSIFMRQFVAGITQGALKG